MADPKEIDPSISTPEKPADDPLRVEVPTDYDYGISRLLIGSVPNEVRAGVRRLAEFYLPLANAFVGLGDIEFSAEAMELRITDQLTRHLFDSDAALNRQAMVLLRKFIDPSGRITSPSGTPRIPTLEHTLHELPEGTGDQFIDDWKSAVAEVLELTEFSLENGKGPMIAAGAIDQLIEDMIPALVDAHIGSFERLSQQLADASHKPRE